MPHRVEPFTMSSHRRHYDQPRLSPPPSIATIPHSQSPTPSVASVDGRSSVSTPPVRRSPPSTSSNNPPPSSASSASAAGGGYYNHEYRYRSDPQQQQLSHPPPPPPPHYYHPHPHAHAHAHPQQHFEQDAYHHQFVPMPLRDPYGHPYPLPGQSPVAIVHTDDAATKLSDRVRRRCFNCCTTDTSTWRRSNLSPGKVLCNKCGLFERTHSRPRPDQFPHKRGPLASSTLRGKTPPQAPHQHPSLHHQQQQGQQQQLPPINYSYNPPIAPLQHPGQGGQTLPGLGAWHDGVSSRKASGENTSSGGSAGNGGSGKTPVSTPKLEVREKAEVGSRD
ncbi:hypothetical protein BDQ17DRAFT_1372947 [Cyathus striatus]|nr:hypothetical protein BDQ17DRAFT_1372947 [Cyathus striatus]